MEREINSLSDDELDAVAGGRMSNGQINQLVLKTLTTGFRAVVGAIPNSGQTSLWA